MGGLQSGGKWEVTNERAYGGGDLMSSPGLLRPQTPPSFLPYIPSIPLLLPSYLTLPYIFLSFPFLTPVSHSLFYPHPSSSHPTQIPLVLLLQLPIPHPISCILLPSLDVPPSPSQFLQHCLNLPSTHHLSVLTVSFPYLLYFPVFIPPLHHYPSLLASCTFLLPFLLFTTPFFSPLFLHFTLCSLSLFASFISLLASYDSFPFFIALLSLSLVSI